jgi:hypothetical protein
MKAAVVTDETLDMRAVCAALMNANPQKYKYVQLLTRDLLELNNSAIYSMKRCITKEKRTLLVNLTEPKRHRRFQISMAVRVHTPATCNL